MASGPASQIDVSSFDMLGASVVTATRSAINSRLGSFYDNTTIAAGALVHVHQVIPTQLLVAFSRRWTAATPSSTRAGYFSAYTEDTAPSWFLVGPSGGRTLIDNTPVIPIVTAVDSAVLVDATSREPQYIYLLHSVTQGSVTSGLLQHFRSATAGRIVPVNEEIVPGLPIQGVTFDKGVALTGAYVTVFGTDSDGHVFTARKLWNAVGVQGYKSAQRGTITTAWQFSTGTGWDTNAANAAPEPGLNSAGPVSYARWRGTHYLSTVVASGNNRSSQIYTQYTTRPWKAQGAPVALGSVSDGTYLGGTLQFQPTLGATAALINTPSSETAFPYLTAKKATNGSEQSIQVAWGVVQVPRMT